MNPCQTIASIQHPAVREGWLRGTAAQHNGIRGGDAFVQVDWDTAFELIVREMHRVQADGSGLELGIGTSGRSVPQANFAAEILQVFEQECHQVCVIDYAPVTGAPAILAKLVGAAKTKCLLDSPRTELPRYDILLNLGMRDTEPAVSTPLGRALLAGGEIIDVSPFRPATASNNWLPIRPGTEAAFLLALCTELEIQDLGGVAQASSGNSSSARRRHLLHGRDGEAFDPVWAALICGLSAKKICALARKFASSRVLINIGLSALDTPSGEQACRAGFLLSSMLRKSGPPAETITFCAFDAKPPELNFSEPLRRVVASADDPRQASVRMAFYPSIDVFRVKPDLNQLLRRWAQLDTVIVAAEHWTATARHADIVLPVLDTEDQPVDGKVERSSKHSGSVAKSPSAIISGLRASLGIDLQSKTVNVNKGSEAIEPVIIEEVGELIGFPTWHRGFEWLGSPLARRYPIHLVKSIRRRRLIGSRAIVWLHPHDALERGLHEGDTVRIWNGRGACLADLGICANRLHNVAEMLPAYDYEPLVDGAPGSLDTAGVLQILVEDRSVQGASLDCLVEIEAWRLDPPALRVISEPRFTV